jgi:hypothetical protein
MLPARALAGVVVVIEAVLKEIRPSVDIRSPGFALKDLRIKLQPDI